MLTQTGGRYSAKFRAVAYVTDQVTPGQTDPINNRYHFKLGKGRVIRTGESDLKGKMSFALRNVV